MRSFLCPLSTSALNTFTRPFACCFYTEINMPSTDQEVKTNGGVAYEVILSEPKLDTIKRPISPPKKQLSMEHIASKLEAAEERRKSLEASLRTRLAEERAMAQEKLYKVMQENNNFQEETKHKLDEKMHIFEANRSAHFHALQQRLQEREIRGQQVRNHKRSMSQENAENGN
ncbi:stathmin-like isoform X2 [Ptychodera flava]|uniref:stathmin-like isoform X2 n=1 Tax=Ptychodera flava TaxID=63121 RepID=UPI00396A9B61